MELNKAHDLAVELMNKHGLFKHGWKFKFDKAVKRAGLCNYTYKIISLSQIRISDNEESLIKNTILHEIAHALVGHKHGHDTVWRQKAKEIGCTGERCTGGYTKIEGKYEGVCPNGHISSKHRKPKKKRSCGRCSRTFDERFLIVYTERNIS